MSMPNNLILVRHGESEGNVANKLSRKGDNRHFTDEFKKRHSSEWRLTDKGRSQADAAKDWLYENSGTINLGFDRYYVSTYIRAMETAARLGLQNAEWYRDVRFRERNWGDLDVITDEERKKMFKNSLQQREINKFYWSPPNGESIADLYIRIRNILDSFSRNCSEGNVIAVCHGEVMWTFRILLEHLSNEEFCELDESKNSFDHIHNCQILHYSRINPNTPEVAKRFKWVRSICPWDLNLSSNEWKEIVRKKYSNEQLLEEVGRIPILVR